MIFRFAMAVWTGMAFASVGGAETLRIVAPSGSDSREGGTFIPSSKNNPYRAQELYMANDFQDLPVGGAWLIGVADRADSTQRKGVTVGYEHLTLSVGTTQSNHLSLDFADNLGAAAHVANDGPTESVYIVNEEPTNPFVEIDPFDTPFLYDPADGNLVIDWLTPSGESELIRWDSRRVPERRGSGGSVNGRRAAHLFDNSLIQQFTFVPVGDVNYDGSLDAMDVDELTPGRIDLNGDDTIDTADRRYWVHEIMSTWFGDSNFDGEFNSSDLVEVFKSGKFELDEAANWSSGDWNGDGRFDSGDLVTAFQDGGFEQGRRTQPAAVPEPSSCILMAIALATMIRRIRLGSRSN